MLGRAIGVYGVGLVFLLGMAGFVGSNVVGAVLGWHPNLGQPWFRIDGVGLYAPWDLIEWWFRWGDAVPELRIGWGVVSFVCLVGVFSIIGKRLTVVAAKPARALDANDGWGSEFDLRAAGLVSGRGYGELGGLVLGQLANGKLITYGGREHMIVSGTTGSGKTAGEVVPCCMSWRGSIVVSDPKRELYAIVGGYRESLGPSFYFDATDVDSACFNPLDTEVRWGTTFEHGDIANLVRILSDTRRVPEQTDASRHYSDLGRSLLTAICLCLPRDGLSFGGILRRLGDFRTDILPLMVGSRNAYSRTIGLEFQAADEKAKAGGLTVVRQMLDVFSDDLVHEKTSRSDFALGDIFASERPMSLFLQTRKDEAYRLGPLVMLVECLLVQCSLHDERRLRDGRLKRQNVLLVCEEFAAQGEKRVISDNLLVLRSYGVTVMIVTQSIKDLERVYGRSNTILSMCKAAVMYASLDDHEQEIIAANCGTKSVVEEAVRKDAKDGGGYRISRSSKVANRRVIDASGVRALPNDSQVLLMLGQRKAYLVKKSLWYNHPVFKELGKDTHGMVDVECLQSRFILDKRHAEGRV